MLGKLATGHMVRLHAGSHYRPEIENCITTALRNIDGSFFDGKHTVIETVDFGERIGRTTCIEIDSSCPTFFAQRPKRNGLSRFGLGDSIEAKDTNLLTVILKRGAGREYYTLTTAYFGPKVPVEPFSPLLINDQQMKRESIDFWRTHVLVPRLPGRAEGEDFDFESVTTELTEPWRPVFVMA